MTNGRTHRPRPHFYIAPVAAMFAAVAAAGGCGGSTTTTTTAANRPSSQSVQTAPVAPTRAQFIARADAICGHTNARLKPLSKRIKALTHQSEAVIESEGATDFRQAAAITREGIAQLQTLPVPTGDAATVQKIIAALDDEAADIDNIAAATARGEWSAVEAAKRADQTTKTTYQGLAQGYGFKVCGAAS